MDFKDKKITVMGLGESGLAAARLLCRAGARVWATDSGNSSRIKETAQSLSREGVKVETGGHTKAFVDAAKLIVVSPGVPLNIPVLQQARDQNIKIISEIELGYLFCQSPLVAITGTNGKSTVVTLVGEIFSKAGLKAKTCGNISPAFCSVVADSGPDTKLVMEVSSYQLELIDTFRPRVSVILNFTPDHLEHHHSFDGYIKAKFRICENQQEEDYFIINENLRAYLKKTGRVRPKILTYSFMNTQDVDKDRSFRAFFDRDKLFVQKGKSCKEIIAQDQIRLKGAHNMENILAAVLAASVSGIEPESIAKTLAEFKGLTYRIEHFLTYKGVDFIDDSKGTNVEATLCALETVNPPIILIAGGKDKGLDYGMASELVQKKVKLLILIGEAKKAIKEALAKVVSVKEASTMEEAVSLAYKHAQPGDKVLLSPMCSSFDMFDNFEHRGNVFKALVRDLAKKQ